MLQAAPRICWLGSRSWAPPAPAAAGARRFAAPLLRPLLLCSAPNPASARQPGAPGRLTRPANSLEAGSGWPPAPAGLLAAPRATLDGTQTVREMRGWRLANPHAVPGGLGRLPIRQGVMSARQLLASRRPYCLSPWPAQPPQPQSLPPALPPQRQSHKPSPQSSEVGSMQHSKQQGRSKSCEPIRLIDCCCGELQKSEVGERGIMERWCGVSEMFLRRGMGGECWRKWGRREEWRGVVNWRLWEWESGGGVCGGV